MPKLGPNSFANTSDETDSVLIGSETLAGAATWTGLVFFGSTDRFENETSGRSAFDLNFVFSTSPVPYFSPKSPARKTEVETETGSGAETEAACFGFDSIFG